LRAGARQRVAVEALPCVLGANNTIPSSGAIDNAASHRDVIDAHVSECDARGRAGREAGIGPVRDGWISGVKNWERTAWS
jgi:hypothetical protein